MSDQLLQRLGKLFLLCCVLAVGTVTGWASFACMAWSARELSHQVSTLTAERDQLISQRNVMGAELEQLQRSERERANLETKIPAAGSEQLVESAESAAAKGDITALIKRKLGPERDDVSQTGSIRQQELKRSRR
jgi:outer membrane murein-binding lipoprotein Lpp